MQKSIYLLIIAVLFTAGCVAKAPVQGTPTITSEEIEQIWSSQPTETKNTANVVTLGIFTAIGKNWDADADVDGLSVILQPKDSKDLLVETSGTFTATLWKLETDENFNQVKGALIGSWTGTVKSTDYDYLGVELHLEYGPGQRYEQYATGWLEIAFTTPDGKTFEARSEYAFLNGL